MGREGKCIQKHSNKKQVGERTGLLKTLRMYHTDHKKTRHLCDSIPKRKAKL